MRILPALTLTLALLGPAQAPAQDPAQDPGQSPGNPDLSQGAELLSQGLRLILRGLAEELEPLEESWAQLIELLGDMSAYDPPEVLPNGDILIRRRHPLPPAPQKPDAAPDTMPDPEADEIEL